MFIGAPYEGAGSGNRNRTPQPDRWPGKVYARFPPDILWFGRMKERSTASMQGETRGTDTGWEDRVRAALLRETTNSGAIFP